MMTKVYEVREYDRVIGYVGNNEENKLFARLPGHGWELIELDTVPEGVTEEEIKEKLFWSMSASYYAQSAYL